MPFARSTALPLALAALLLAGCGDDLPAGTERPETTVKAYFGALARDDYDRACDLLTRGVRRELAAFGVERLQGVTSCPRVLRRVLEAGSSAEQRRRLADVHTGDVLIKGDRAVVQVSGATAAPSLLRVDGHWLIARLDL